MSLDHLSPEIIGAFVDSELTPPEQASVHDHLKECHPCALLVVEMQRMKSATSHAARRFSPPAETLARLEAQLNRQSVLPARVLPWRNIAWLGIAAGVLLVLSIAGVRQFRTSDTLSAELLDQHLAVLPGTAAPQVLSSDRHTVKPWFQGKLPFSFNVPEPSTMPPDTNLVGADLTYLDGRPTAMLLFTIHKHRVSVFISQAGVLQDLALPHSRAGFEMVRAHSGGLEIVGVSDVNRSDLDNLMAVLTQAQ